MAEKGQTYTARFGLTVQELGSAGGLQSIGACIDACGLKRACDWGGYVYDLRSMV